MHVFLATFATREQINKRAAMQRHVAAYRQFDFPRSSLLSYTTGPLCGCNRSSNVRNTEENLLTQGHN